MILHEQLRGNESQNTGKNLYRVDGIPISVGWKQFTPGVVPHNPHLENPRMPEIDVQSKAVIYLPSWSITEQAISAGRVSQAFADASGLTTYAVDTRMDKLTARSSDQEAEAARRFIEERGIQEVTIVGSSHGGRLAVTIADFLQKQNQEIIINGLVLSDSVSLEQKSLAQLWHDLHGDVGRDIPLLPLRLVRGIGRKAVGSLKNMSPRRVLPQMPPARKGVDYYLDGFIEVAKELKRSDFNPGKLVGRVRTEIETNAQRNPHLSEIAAPVVILFGEDDKVANPSTILSQARRIGIAINPDAQSLVDPVSNKRYSLKEQQARTDVLRNILPNSPQALMLVTRKQGDHGLIFNRPDAVANVSIGLLNRFHREQAK